MNAEIIKAEPNPTFPGAVIVTVLCPLCGKKHVHGVPAQDVGTQAYGHRVSHCTERDGADAGYVLTDLHGLVQRVRGAGGVQAGAPFGTPPRMRVKGHCQRVHPPAPVPAPVPAPEHGMGVPGDE